MVHVVGFRAGKSTLDGRFPARAERATDTVAEFGRVTDMNADRRVTDAAGAVGLARA